MVIQKPICDLYFELDYLGRSSPLSFPRLLATHFGATTNASALDFCKSDARTTSLPRAS